MQSHNKQHAHGISHGSNLRLVEVNITICWNITA